jgi:hypothetical protein
MGQRLSATLTAEMVEPTDMTIGAAPVNATSDLSLLTCSPFSKNHSRTADVQADMQSGVEDTQLLERRRCFIASPMNW